MISESRINRGGAAGGEMPVLESVGEYGDDGLFGGLV